MPVERISAGDRVEFIDYDGQRRVGKAVMPSTHGGWVLNLGGKYGTPAVVDERHIVNVRKARRNPYDLFELEEVESPVSRFHRPLRSNPELLIVGSNPMRRKRRMARRRGRRRNSPVTVRIGRHRHTWKGLRKKFVKKYGVKRGMKMAGRAWRKGKKFHGYTKDRIVQSGRRRRRRRKARNSWFGAKRRHRCAAKKGWRRRRRRGRKGRRKSSKRSRAAKRGWAKRRRGRKGRRKKARNRRRRAFRRN